MKANEVYARVRERDQHRCQFPIETDPRLSQWRKCGVSFRAEAHHRWMRSQGGPDTMENLILLCPEHHAWCHLNPAEATDMGLIVQEEGGYYNMARHYWMDEAIPEDGYFDEEDHLWDREPGDGPW